ncbi:hypothetical protein D9M73_89160 [compost metagenome]
MSERVLFRLNQFEPFHFDVGAERFTFRDTSEYAVIGNVPAGISDQIRLAPRGRFFRITVVEDPVVHNPTGVEAGWYVVNEIDKERAEKLRASWAVLRSQPTICSGSQ